MYIWNYISGIHLTSWLVSTVRTTGIIFDMGWIFLYVLAFHRIAKLLVGWGWKKSLEVVWSSLPALAGSPGVGFPLTLQQYNVIAESMTHSLIIHLNRTPLKVLLIFLTLTDLNVSERLKCQWGTCEYPLSDISYIIIFFRVNWIMLYSFLCIL